jgi:hypothetical protein
MEKPVRIESNEKIRGFNEKVRNGLEHALNFMLATDDSNKIAIGNFEPFLMPIEAYISAYKKRSILIKIMANKAFVGELYWFFELKSAVVLGGLLRQLQPSVLQEKAAKGDFDAMDQDAFGEVGNQLCGILDRAFRMLTNKNIHLKMDFNKKVYPDESIKVETFLNREEYVVLLCEIGLPAYGKEKITLLLPRTLYEVLLNLEIQLQGITPKILLVHSWSPERVEAMQRRLNSRYTKVLALEKPEDVLDRLATPNLVAVALDLKPLTFPLPLGEAMLFKRFAANRTFMRLPQYLTWEQPTDQGLQELKKLGFGGATVDSLEAGFPNWAHTFTQDPSFKS